MYIQPLKVPRSHFSWPFPLGHLKFVRWLVESPRHSFGHFHLLYQVLNILFFFSRVSPGCLQGSPGFANVYMVLKWVYREKGVCISDLKGFSGFSRLCRFNNIQSSSFIQQNSNSSNWIFLSETNCSEVIVRCNSSSGIAFFVDINPGPPQHCSVKLSRTLSPFYLPCKTIFECCRKISSRWSLISAGSI